MKNPLDLLRNHLGCDNRTSDKYLQAIVNVCAEIIVIQDMQDMQEYEDKTRQAIDSAGGCSVCGDLNGYSCICDDKTECDDESTL